MALTGRCLDGEFADRMATPRFPVVSSEALRTAARRCVSGHAAGSERTGNLEEESHAALAVLLAEQPVDAHGERRGHLVGRVRDRELQRVLERGDRGELAALPLIEAEHPLDLSVVFARNRQQPLAAEGRSARAAGGGDSLVVKGANALSARVVVTSRCEWCQTPLFTTNHQYEIISRRDIHRRVILTDLAAEVALDEHAAEHGRVQG